MSEDVFESTETALEPARSIVPDRQAPNNPGSSGDLVFCTLGSPESLDANGKRALYNLITADDRNIDDYLNQPIRMVAAAGTRLTFVNEQTGEVDDSVRSSILADDGHYYSCCSTGILQSLDRIARYVESPPWREPITVIPRKRKTSKGFPYFVLELADELAPDPPEPAPAKKK